jgi:hypothetical protein
MCSSEAVVGAVGAFPSSCVWDYIHIQSGYMYQFSFLILYHRVGIEPTLERIDTDEKLEL